MSYAVPRLAPRPWQRAPASAHSRSVSASDRTPWQSCRGRLHRCSASAAHPPRPTECRNAEFKCCDTSFLPLCCVCAEVLAAGRARAAPSAAALLLSASVRFAVANRAASPIMSRRGALARPDGIGAVDFTRTRSDRAVAQLARIAPFPWRDLRGAIRENEPRAPRGALENPGEV